MATIPTLTTPRVRQQAAPRVPLPQGVEQPGNTQNAFGQNKAARTGQLAKGLADAGTAAQNTSLVLQQANDRLQAREDSIARLRALDLAEQEIQKAVLAEQSGGDLSKPENVAALRTRISEIRSKHLQKFEGGLPENKLLFQEELEKSNIKWGAYLTEQGRAAGKAAQNAFTTRKVKDLAGMVSNNPESLPDALADFNSYIDTHIAPGTNPADTEEQRGAGLETIATSAVDFMISGRQYDEALALMSSPTVQPHLSVARARDLRLKVYVGRSEATKVEAGIRARLSILEEAGVSLTPDQTASIVAGMDLTTTPTAPKTLAGKVAELERMMSAQTGKPYTATPEQVEKLAGAQVTEASGPYGNSMQGRAMSSAETLAPAIESGNFTEEQFVEFLNRASVAASENVTTGVKMGLSLPVRAALAAQGISARDISSPDGLQQFLAARERIRGSIGQPGVSTQRAQSTSEGQAAVSEAMGAVAPRVTMLSNAVQNATQLPDGTADTKSVMDNVEASGVKFYDFADDLTGITSTLADRVSGVDPLGLVIQAPETRQIRADFAIAVKNPLVFALREGAREVDAERKAMIADVRTLETGWFKSPSALQNDMIGLDNGLARLEVRLQDALAKEGEVSGSRYRDLQDRLETIQYVRRVLGVPPIAATEADYNRMLQEGKLGPGDRYRADDGKVYSVPGAAEEAN